jgi:hypothetical protein
VLPAFRGTPAATDLILTFRTDVENYLTLLAFIDLPLTASLADSQTGFPFFADAQPL